MKNKSYDFGGYATKVGVKCSDGRTITQDAFQENDGQTVPLVWQHLQNTPGNILGHARLENRKDGVYAYCSFNNSQSAQDAKEAIKHGDIKALSIYANSLIEKAKNVVHGAIREVSLVIAGANPEAYIDNIAFQHGDGSIVADETEAIICVNTELEHSTGKSEDKTLQHAKEDDDETIADVFNAMTDKQKTVVYAMLAEAIGDDEDDDSVAKHSEEDYNGMKQNAFETNNKKMEDTHMAHAAFTREELRAIFEDARKSQSTLKNAFLAHGHESMTAAYAAYEDHSTTLQHAGEYGIDNIGYLFPDYKATSNSPAFLKRDTEWVSKVFGASKHVPFARIKTVVADITADEARARGYIKGKEKTDEVISLLKRTTDPQTVYKKQKLDRDDVVDITDFDVVVWLRAEMRMMLEEEIARAELVGDGRSTASDDKIQETKIRPIATDDPLYTVKITLDETATTSQAIDAIVMGRKQYKGTGNPSFFTTPDVNGDMLLLKDSTGRRIYNTESDLAAGLRAKEIVEVPVMENVVKIITPAGSGTTGLQERLIGIMVNMIDYSLGADKGGNVAMMDDFDIDFNQYKYLIETRCSGALTIPKAAIAYWKQEVIPAE